MAQKLVDDAVVRYHTILESEPYRNLEWAEALAERMRSHGLVAGTRLVSPFLRPHFLTKAQFDHLAKASEALHAAIQRIQLAALQNPALLARMDLLPAEKMLASIDPGYSFLHVASLLNTTLNNGTLQFRDFQASATVGLAYGEILSDLLYDAPPVKEFRKKNSLTKLGGIKHLLAALSKAFKAFGGKTQPSIAILEFRQPFHTVESAEYSVMVELFRKHGFQAELVQPEQLDYRNGVLRKGDFVIDLIFRASSLQEFLLRFDLSHPLVRAYREGKVCMVNSFRAELGQKRSVFALLTDQQVTANFPAAEREAIDSFIPWTRVLAQGKTQKKGETIDLMEYIVSHREQLVLAPNDGAANLPSFEGAACLPAAWERALKQVLREHYVVQERIPKVSQPFPVLSYGEMEMREMNVDVHPHAFLGKVQSCTAQLTAGQGGFSTMEGVAATYLLGEK
jgi:hypothetical protein